jgi:thiol-disulfide isomerase/thioredoxin
MRIHFIFLLISAITSISCFSQEESRAQKLQPARPAIVSVSFKPGESLTFMIFDTYNQPVHFTNFTKKDTIITREIAIDKPSLLAYNNMLVLPTAPLLRSYPLLLIPGDTVLLKKGIDGAISLHYSSGYQNFIDSLISVPKSFHWPGSEQQMLLKTTALKEKVQMIENTFRKNEVLIGNLKLSDIRADIMRKVNGNIKYTSTAYLLSDPRLNMSSVTDSLYDDLYRHIDGIQSLNTINNAAIYEAIIKYNAKKRDQYVDKKDIWACVAATDEQLKQTELYKNYVTTLIATGFVYTPEDMSKINQVLKSIQTQTPSLDTLYRLSNILTETFTDFKQARQKLKTFADGRYSFIIENDERSANHQKKTIKNLPMVALFDFAGKQSDFKRIVMNKRYKLTLVDFWASWCVPCIAEMPRLRTIEDKLKGKPIQFVTVSIDEDDQVNKWIEAAKRNKIFTKPSQFRLANFKKSSLTELINLKVIPRYLVIDNEGNILDEDFDKPSNPRFQMELLKYLN